MTCFLTVLLFRLRYLRSRRFSTENTTFFTINTPSDAQTPNVWLTFVSSRRKAMYFFEILSSSPTKSPFKWDYFYSCCFLYNLRAHYVGWSFQSPKDRTRSSGRGRSFLMKAWYNSDDHTRTHIRTNYTRGYFTPREAKWILLPVYIPWDLLHASELSLKQSTRSQIGF